MHILVGILALVVAVVALPFEDTPWKEFKLAHNRVYDSPEEEELRFKIFQDNLKRIDRHNALFEAGLETYELGVTQFADMTEEEFKQYLTYSGPNTLYDDSVELYRPPVGAPLPKSVDYRTKKAVNSVKNQASCGSCWAFSAVGSLESLNFLKTGKLLRLSEQNLVDCSRKYGNYGCSGGWMESSYNYIQENGLEDEESYPYTARDGTCAFNKTKSVIRVKGFERIATNNETDLQSAIANVGPIAVAVDASQWFLYKSGIFSVKRWYGLNHGVVAIGYGVEKGQEYYIVRNSWGSGWGEQGYIRVARNQNNQVGIASKACYPKL